VQNLDLDPIDKERLKKIGNLFETKRFLNDFLAHFLNTTVDLS
jgi:hypothetical protein